MTKRRKYVVLVRRNSPKNVTFNGRSFNANFRCGKRSELPPNIRFRKYKRTKAKKRRVPAWLNSIGRRKHARKIARNALATKKAIKKITKKVHFDITTTPKASGIKHIRGKKGPSFFHKWTGKPIKNKIGKRQAAARARRRAKNPSPHRIRTKKTPKRMSGKELGDVARSIASNPYAKR